MNTSYHKIMYRMDVHGVTLNGISWWGSSFLDLGSVEYPTIAMTPRFTLNRRRSWCKDKKYVKYTCLKID